ncbi:MAG: SpvB/TcaC N-terminal domain-containing protein [Salibacteraceae bacterium]
MKRLVWIIALPVVVGVAMYGTFSNTTETTATSSELGGALHTNFSVNSQGASTFNIPLHVAPGTNKNQPGLALTYNSLQGNGMLGVGWTLSGLSVIERVPATVAQDGFWGSINYDSNDRFALDGHRLMLVRAYGNDSCLYHTEVESWSKVMAYGQQANPNSFVVYTKNGHRVEYGTTSDAQIQNADQSAIRSWAMNKSMDLNRNFFTVQYLQLTGKSSYYPQRIDYTYHVDTAGDTLLNSQRAVVFAYQSRVDTVPDFSEGGLVQDSLLLCKVTSMVLDDSIMHYALDYEFDSLTALSRLVDIRQIDGLGNALPTTTFDYQTASDTLFMPIAPPDTLAVIPQGLSNFSVDVNGDGKTDLLQFWPQSHTLYYGLSISQGQHLESPVIEATALNYSISQIQLFSLDIDGNGDQEVVAQFGTYGDTAMYYVVFDYNGSKLNVSDTFTTHLSAENITLMGTDVNGDGKGDLLYVSGSLSPPSMLQYAVGLSNGSAFVFPDSLTPTALPWSPNLLLVPARINDDPMTDLVFALIDSSQATLDLVTLLSTGDQFQLTDTLPTAVGLGYNQIIPMDMNGDGLTDIGLSWQPQGQNGKFSTFLSNSTGLDSSYTVLYDFPNNYGSILPLDLNGDNKSDFLFRGTNNANEVQFTPYLSNGIQFSVKDTLPSTGVSWTDYIDGIPGDVNGDGKSDIIHLTSIPQILTECQYTLMFANATYPNLIDGYSNGIGGQIEVTYKPLTDTTVYRKSTVAEGNYLNGINAVNRVTGANFPVGSPSYQNCNYGTSSGGTFPVLNVDFPRYAVSSYSKSDGRGSRYPYGLFYEEALMDMNGRWWLGFQSKSLVDSSEQSIAQTYYQQAFPFTGLVDSSIVRYLIDNSKLYGKRFTYDSLLLQSKANDSIYMVQKKNSSTDYFDYGSYAFTTGKNYTYDAYGNVKSIENLSDTAGTQPVVYELHEYQNDTGIWQLGFLTSRQLATTKSGSDTLQYKAITYDNNKNILSKADWDDQQQWWITHQFGYAPYGNQQFVVDPSGDTTTTVYDSVYFSFIAQTVSPSLPNLESGNTIQLVTTTRYDSAFGVQLARTDANGNSFYQALDGLGRVIAKYGPDPNDSTTLLEQMSWTNVGDSGYAMLHQQLQDWGSDNWVSSQVYYDGLIRKYRTVGLGNSPSQNRVTEMHLDSKNRVVWQSLPYFQHQTGDYGISHQYDPYGNLTKIVLPKGTSDSIVNTYTYFYTEKEVKRVHAKGTANAEKLHTGFDFYFNKRRHAYYVAANGDTTWLSHDPLARLSGALDPKAIPTQISYSSLSRKVLINDPSFQQVHYQYLDSLKTAFQINANGDSIVERMDALNRIAVKKYAPFDSIQYRYDQGAAYNSLGRLSEVLLPGSDLLTYEYDAYGHPSKISLNIDSKVLFLEYQYRPDGKLSSITYPDSSVLQYSYTAQNWLKYLQFWDGVTHDSTTYGYYQQHNAQGQAKLISYGNNTRHEYSYDPTGMVDSTRLYLKDANGNDSLAVQHAYAHDYLLRLTQLSALNNDDLSQSF